jgi:hypothetical protein
MRLSHLVTLGFATSVLCSFASPVAAQNYDKKDIGVTAATRAAACDNAKRSAPNHARNHGGTLVNMSECKCYDQAAKEVMLKLREMKRLCE